MTPELFYSLIIGPTLSELTAFDKKPGLDSSQADVMMLAIAIQESGLKARRQMPKGPARGYWQIEPPTAIDTLIRYRPARDFCTAIGIKIPTLSEVGGELKKYASAVKEFQSALEWNDSAAGAIARGILRLDKKPLPAVGDEADAWSCYLRCWRPGNERPEKWPLAYELAMEALK